MSSPRREKYHCSVFDHDSYLEGSGSWRKEARKKKMKSEIRKLGMDREEGKKKGKTDEKEKKKAGFWWYFRVKFCQDLLNVHGPLFYDNEQTVEFDFNLK